MSLLIGSGEGVFRMDGSAEPRPIDGLEGRSIRVFCQANGSLLVEISGNLRLPRGGFVVRPPSERAIRALLPP